MIHCYLLCINNIYIEIIVLFYIILFNCIRIVISLFLLHVYPSLFFLLRQLLPRDFKMISI